MRWGERESGGEFGWLGLFCFGGDMWFRCLGIGERVRNGGGRYGNDGGETVVYIWEDDKGRGNMGGGGVDDGLLIVRMMVLVGTTGGGNRGDRLVFGVFNFSFLF